MIYLKDKETGVTVEDCEPLSDGPVMVRMRGPHGLYTAATHDEADAILRGLLRWKLEIVGRKLGTLFMRDVLAAWMKERAAIEENDDG